MKASITLGLLLAACASTADATFSRFKKLPRHPCRGRSLGADRDDRGSWAEDWPTLHTTAVCEEAGHVVFPRIVTCIDETNVEKSLAGQGVCIPNPCEGQCNADTEECTPVWEDSRFSDHLPCSLFDSPDALTGGAREFWQLSRSWAQSRPNVCDCRPETEGCSGAICSCKMGLQRDPETSACVDVDECVGASPLELCGSEFAVCSNTVGGYECPCQDGFELRVPVEGAEAPVDPCGDIDECAAASPPCNGAGEVCVNTLGGFTCGCNDGYTRAEDDASCVDINECADATACNGVGEVCVNQVGGFACECATGFRRDAGGVLCVEKLACTATTCLKEAQVCQEPATLGGPPTCVCQPQYVETTDSAGGLVCAKPVPPAGAVWTWDIVCGSLQRKCPLSSQALVEVPPTVEGGDATYTCDGNAEFVLQQVLFRAAKLPDITPFTQAAAVDVTDARLETLVQQIITILQTGGGSGRRLLQTGRTLTVPESDHLRMLVRSEVIAMETAFADTRSRTQPMFTELENLSNRLSDEIEAFRPDVLDFSSGTVQRRLTDMQTTIRDATETQTEINSLLTTATSEIQARHTQLRQEVPLPECATCGADFNQAIATVEFAVAVDAYTDETDQSTNQLVARPTITTASEEAEYPFPASTISVTREIGAVFVEQAASELLPEMQQIQTSASNVPSGTRVTTEIPITVMPTPAPTAFPATDRPTGTLFTGTDTGGDY